MKRSMLLLGTGIAGLLLATAVASAAPPSFTRKLPNKPITPPRNLIIPSKGLIPSKDLIPSKGRVITPVPDNTRTLIIPKNPNLQKPNLRIVPPPMPLNGINPGLITEKKKQEIQMYMKKGNLNDQEKNALNKILSGEALSAADREALSGLLVGEREGMSAEVRETITQALTEDGEAQRTAKMTRYLRLYNSTSESIRVWVQYHAYTDKSTWVWYPARPDESTKAVAYDLRPGQALDAIDEDWKVHASRVRLWARTAGGKLINQYRNQDLVLVPEVDEDGNPCYYAAELETYTHTFGNVSAVVTGLKR